VAVRKILERMPPVARAVITGDAINTQQEFAHTIVWEKGALSRGVERQPTPIRQTAKGCCATRSRPRRISKP